MKIKLDENLPDRLASVLEALGHNVDTVRDEGLAGQDEATVWLAAQGEGRFFVTQDLDFSDMRQYAPGTHAGLLVVRLAHPGLAALFERSASMAGVGAWWSSPIKRFESKGRLDCSRCLAEGKGTVRTRHRMMRVS